MDLSDGKLGEPKTRPTGRMTARSDRKSTRLNSSHVRTSYAVFCLQKKNINEAGSSGGWHQFEHSLIKVDAVDLISDESALRYFVNRTHMLQRLDVVQKLRDSAPLA